MVTLVVPTLEVWRWDNQKFQVILGYMLSLRLACATGDPENNKREVGEDGGGRERRNLVC